jgi:ferritin
MKKEMYDLLNKQMNYEIYSSYIYLDMSAYCESIDMEGFASWFKKQYQEELEHAFRFRDYLLQAGYRPTYSNWDESPTGDYDSILEIAKLSLAHEQTVTERIEYLMDQAQDIKDYSTINFLNWFISEQQEEEATFNTMISKLNTVKDAGLYMLDKDYGQR